MGKQDTEGGGEGEKKKKNGTKEEVLAAAANTAQGRQWERAVEWGRDAGVNMKRAGDTVKRAGDNVKSLARDKAPLVVKTVLFGACGAIAVGIAGRALH